MVERELAMRRGSPSLAVVHRLLAGGPVRLKVEALGTWRDAHRERHTANATLWFLHAVERHVARAGDEDLAARLLPGLDDVLAAHVRGNPLRHPRRPVRQAAGQG